MKVHQKGFICNVVAFPMSMLLNAVRYDEITSIIQAFEAPLDILGSLALSYSPRLGSSVNMQVHCYICVQLHVINQAVRDLKYVCTI